MNRLEKLKRRRAELLKANEALLDVADATDSGLMTDEQQTSYDANMAEVDKINGQVGRVELLNAQARDELVEASEELGGEGGDASATGVTRIKDLALDRPWAGESTEEQLGSFLSAVVREGHPQYKGDLDPRLKWEAAATGHGVTVPADGGFLVEKTFMTQLLRKTFESGQFLSKVTKIPITNPTSSGLTIKRLKEISRRNGARWGGFRAYWEGEGDLLTASKTEFEEIKLNLHKLTGLAYASGESLQDAGALGTIIQNGFQQEFRFKIEDAAFNGTGVGSPLGIMNSTGRISVTKETNQSAASVVAENISKMWARCDARFRLNAIWFINQELEPELDKMNFAVGTGGQLIYMPPGGFNDAPFGRLKGRPVVPVEYCSALGIEGDIGLYCPEEYLMIDKGGVRADSSMHVRFLYDEETFRFLYRADGQPALDTPMTPYKGSDTLSPFVTLETRS